MESGTMFKGMQNVLNKLRKKSDDSLPPEPGASLVLPAESLLNTERRKQYTDELRRLINISEIDFNQVFLSVVQNFAEFVQELPETQSSYFSHQGGLLEHGLERAVMSVSMCRAYLLPGEGDLSTLSSDEMLWVYAVFTASLLLDVGKVATKLIVTLLDEKNTPCKVWLPYSGSMIGQGYAYKFEFVAENLDELCNMVTPLLAIQILPEGAAIDSQQDITEEDQSQKRKFPGGFTWIASDNDVLEAWLSMLSGEMRQVGTLLSIIPVIEAQILQGYFAEGKSVNFGLSNTALQFLEKLKERKHGMLEKARKEAHTKKEGLFTPPPLKELAKFSQAAKKIESGIFVKPEAKAAPLFVESGATTRTTVPPVAEKVNTQMAHDFKAWLEQGIADGKITVNEANSFVHIKSEREAIILNRAVEEFAKAQNPAATAEDIKMIVQQIAAAPGVFTLTDIVVMVAQTGQMANAFMTVNPYLIYPLIYGIPLASNLIITNKGNLTPDQYAAMNKPISQNAPTESYVDKVAKETERMNMNLNKPRSGR